MAKSSVTKATRYVPPHLAALLANLKSDVAEEREAAVAGLCLAFESLVKSLAARYWQPVIGAEYEELEQEARCGLVEACATYDEERGTFQAHAMWCMRSTLAGYTQRLENPTRLPTGLLHKRSLLRRTQEKLTCQLKREPTIDELSSEMGVSVSTIESMLAYESGPITLDAPRRLTGRWGKNPYESRISWVEEYQADSLTPEEELIAMEEIEALKTASDRRKKEKVS